MNHMVVLVLFSEEPPCNHSGCTRHIQQCLRGSPYLQVSASPTPQSLVSYYLSLSYPGSLPGELLRSHSLPVDYQHTCFVIAMFLSPVEAESCIREEIPSDSKCILAYSRIGLYCLTEPETQKSKCSKANMTYLGRCLEESMTTGSVLLLENMDREPVGLFTVSYKSQTRQK